MASTTYRMLELSEAALGSKGRCLEHLINLLPGERFAALTIYAGSVLQSQGSKLSTRLKSVGSSLLCKMYLFFSEITLK